MDGEACCVLIAKYVKKKRQFYCLKNLCLVFQAKFYIKHKCKTFSTQKIFILVHNIGRENLMQHNLKNEEGRTK